jgi:predicted branched-subunit amino acid permease
MKDYLAEAKSIANKDKRDILLETTKASTNGAITGLFIGLMVGYYKKYNIYKSALFGAVIGGVATAVLISKK